MEYTFTCIVVAPRDKEQQQQGLVGGGLFVLCMFSVTPTREQKREYFCPKENTK
jgi:hypothetical protein